MRTGGRPNQVYVMNFLLNLLTLPASGPIRGLIWIAEKVAEQADREMYDEESIRGQLAELEIRYELGEINDEKYQAKEDDLIERLKVIRERREAESEVEK